MADFKPPSDKKGGSNGEAGNGTPNPGNGDRYNFANRGLESLGISPQELRKAVVKTRVETSNDLFEEGMGLLNRGERLRGIAKLKSALAFNPFNTAVKFKLGAALFDLMREEGAGDTNLAEAHRLLIEASNEILQYMQKHQDFGLVKHYADSLHLAALTSGNIEEFKSLSEYAAQVMKAIASAAPDNTPSLTALAMAQEMLREEAGKNNEAMSAKDSRFFDILVGILKEKKLLEKTNDIVKAALN